MHPDPAFGYLGFGPLADDQRVERGLGVGFLRVYGEHGSNLPPRAAAPQQSAGRLTVVLNGLANWWDGVELWLAQAWFPVQFVLVMVVVVPLCLLVAWIIDKLVERCARWLGTARDDEGPSGS
ncbi:hypothetical protein GCM10022222_50170 [Amycolatopsis ultiminotia]|uniref:Uncharacterized protein n=1 Tax=Amycolatopsis ultiminotia TaxID=543629 RepID=A0ABP6X2C6_9PSEU